MRRVLVSFLGTGVYKSCNYSYGEKIAHNKTYVQTAIAEIFCKSWDKNDRIFILCTEQAEKIHYSQLIETFNGFNCSIEKVLIPSVSNIDEIWQIFKTITNLIDDGDRVIFDITHSFRSIPMVALAVLNYLDSVKKISIDGIFYGAYEAKVGDTAPIIDLLPLKIVQDWAKAAEIFQKTGRIESIKELTEEKCKGILKETRGSDKKAEKLRKLINEIYSFNCNIEASRSKDVIDKDFDSLKQRITEMKDQDIIEPLNEILDKLLLNLKSFGNDIFKNTFSIIDWCIKYGLIQQGYTYLRELIDSYFVSIQYGKDKIWDKEYREAISEKLYNHMNGKTSSEDFDKVLIFLNSLKKETSKQLSGKLNHLAEFRNDINHCGFGKKAYEYKVLKDKLRDLKNFFEEIILQGV